jgi:EAL domain-containing protein (putative c-di-GMP-specific phosphodiesterase class I)
MLVHKIHRRPDFMENCSRCERLPDPLTGQGKFILSCPLEHTLDKIKTIFDENDHPYSIQQNELLVSRLSVDGLSLFSDEIRENLSEDELKDVQCLWMEEDRELSISDLSSMNSLKEFLSRLEGDWLIEILQEERLYNVFQPIVLAENPDEVLGYECLLRARDPEGNTINPGRIFRTAKESDLLFQLDREARIQAVENGAQFPVNKKIFINFMPTSIYDPEYCLRTTMEAVKEFDLRKEQIVFEVVETEEVDDRENLVEILDYYREEGVNVALDDFGAGYSSLSMLKDLKPNYIKLDLDLVQSVTDDQLSAELAQKILEVSRDNGITTLAEGIETEEQYEWFREKDVDYLQGYYFAKPSENPDLRENGA